MTAHSGAGWRLAGSLILLEEEVNARWPTRDHASDGSIGDVVHSAEGRPSYDAQGYGTSGSDHEPDNLGVVCALDIDSGPGIDPQAFVDAITHEPDPRIGYVIWNHRIFSNREGSDGWAWRAYSGADPHTNHIHVSVRHGQIADNTTPWAIASTQPQPKGPSNMFLTARSTGAAFLVLDSGAHQLANNAEYVSLRDDAHIPVAKLTDASIDALVKH